MFGMKRLHWRRELLLALPVLGAVALVVWDHQPARVPPQEEADRQLLELGVRPRERAPILGPGRVPAVGERFRDCENCPDMVVLPPGRHTTRIVADGVPETREIVVEEPFAIGQYPVTVREMIGCARVRPSGYGEYGCGVPRLGNRLDKPSEQVNRGWDWPVDGLTDQKVNAYVKYISDLSGAVYRLPTINEWAYAEQDSKPIDMLNSTAREGYLTCERCVEIGNWGVARPVGLDAKNHFDVFDLFLGYGELVHDEKGGRHFVVESLALWGRYPIRATPILLRLVQFGDEDQDELSTLLNPDRFRFRLVRSLAQ